MQMSLAPKAVIPWLRTRRGFAVIALLVLAAALTVASLSRAGLMTSVGNAAVQAVSNIKTVAAMLADRSPGQRPEGALASLKQKRQPVLHERALPKIRGPISPLAAIVGPPPVPPVVPVETMPPAPLYSMVGAPPVLVPPVVPPVGGGGGGGTPGGPPGFSEIPPPGGGGGVVVPPVTPTVPQVVTPSVPEPNSWAMMLVGFALMGWTLRRDRRRRAQVAAG
jgi:hypothetical protein